MLDRRDYKTAIPQLEKELKQIDKRVSEAACILKTITSEPFTTSTYLTVTAQIPEIKGYTPYVVGAYPRGAVGASGYGYINTYNVSINSDGEATCGARYIGSGTATDAQIRFMVLYIKE